MIDHLTSLPLEIRLVVYGHVFGQVEDVDSWLAVTRVSRKIRNEIIKFLPGILQANTFVFEKWMGRRDTCSIQFTPKALRFLDFVQSTVIDGKPLIKSVRNVVFRFPLMRRYCPSRRVINDIFTTEVAMEIRPVVGSSLAFQIKPTCVHFGDLFRTTRSGGPSTDTIRWCSVMAPDNLFNEEEWLKYKDRTMLRLKDFDQFRMYGGGLSPYFVEHIAKTIELFLERG